MDRIEMNRERKELPHPAMSLLSGADIRKLHLHRTTASRLRATAFYNIIKNASAFLPRRARCEAPS